MDLELRGKVAIIGGASQGIGLATAHALAAEGTNVVLMARNKDKLDAAAAKVGEHGTVVVPVPGDNRSADDIKRVVATTEDRFARIDIVVNNDGAPPLGALADFDDDAWHQAFERNTMSVVRMIRETLPRLREHGCGSIVNVTSLSVLQPIKQFGLSVSTWAAVLGLSKTLSLELAAEGVRINTVCPGRFDTPRLDVVNEQAAVGGNTPSTKVEHQALEQIPLGRVGEPREIADVITFLASPRSSYLTGLALPVDGGKRAGLM